MVRSISLVELLKRPHDDEPGPSPLVPDLFEPQNSCRYGLKDNYLSV